MRSSASLGISRANRPALEELHRSFHGPFTPAEASAVLGVEPKRAHELLAYLARRGWLTRVRRGLYVPVPLEAQVSGEWSEDAWILAAKTFEPCFIGGWSACEHWQLTEQIFRTVIVVTTRRVRDRRPTLQGSPLLVKTVSEHHFFGMRRVWRGGIAVHVSDPSRTVLDVLDDPSLGGGIKHVTEILATYLTGEHRDDDLLLDYATRLGNRTVFKRLGYLTEAIQPAASDLVAACLARRSSGVTKLDPDGPEGGGIDSRWGLRVNVSVEPAS
jgi:predicted transcriptional regulator of viral defense system